MGIKIKTEVKIGLIVLSTILVIIWGVNYLKGRNVLKRTDVYYAVFNNVQGLDYAAPVFISGYKVGLINSIQFDPQSLNRLIVAFAVEKSYLIPKGSLVRIASPDIIASKSLMIDLAESDQYYKFGDTLATRVELGMMDKLQESIEPLIGNAGNALHQMDSLLSALNSTFDENMVNNLKTTMNNAAVISSSLNDQFSKTGDLTKSLASLEQFSATLNDNKDELSKILKNLASISDTIANAGLSETLENLAQVSDELHILLESVNSGEGTLGKLASNDSLYNKLVDVSSSLDLLLIDFKERPKRYVHFSVFGKKDKN
jgi:phospholipid/cholesterol/gamma-HCH transport system substrate-binding protein